LPISRQQVEDFLAGRLSPDDAEIVVKYLLQADREEWDTLLGKEAWDAIDTYKTVLPDAVVERMDLAVIKRNATQKTTVMRILKWSVAAAVALIALFIWWNPGRKVAVLAAAQKNNRTVVAPVTRDSFENRSNLPLWVGLPDSSKVKLFPHSQMTCSKGLTGNHRDIYLEGKAFFKVAKDKTRPFTVYSGNISTTALGTSFTVTAWHNTATVNIELFTGRVVVREKSSKMKDVYLVPGDAVDINCNTYQAKTTVHHANTASQDVQQHQRKDVAVVEVLNFEQEPLEKVFKRLEVLFGRHIRYVPAEIKGMSFTGTLKTALGQEKILSAIAVINGLHMIPEKDGFLIRSIR